MFAAGLLAVIVGGLTGWYFFIQTHSDAIRAADAARGFSTGGLLGTPGISGAPGGPDAASSSGVTFLGQSGQGAPLGNTFLNPDGTLGVADPEGATSTGQRATSTPPQTPQLWHTTKTPVAGFGFVTSEDGTTLVRYAERATGFVFSADPWSGETARLSNTLHPKTQQAYFADETIIERSIGERTLDTFVGTIERTATSSALVGDTLPAYVLAMAVRPDTGDIFYIRPSTTGAEGVVAAEDGTKAKTVFSSPLSNWKPIYLPGRIVVTQLSSDDVPGYAYEVGSNGALSLLVGNVPGLMVAPRASSSAILWSSSSRGTLSLFSRISASSEASQLGIKTIAEKCVWAPSVSDRENAPLFAYCAVPRTAPGSGYLDALHQGVVTTSDAWWQVDARAGASQALYASGESPDVRNPQIDPSGRFIAFIDGRDSSLWVLRIAK